MNFLKMLVDDFHSAVVATVAPDGHPQTRVIDMMLWDSEGVYFLTAKGKAFYEQLMEQKYIALSASKGKAAISLRGKIRNIGSARLDEIFEKNAYMKEIYPDNTRSALEVFQIYEAAGEYFDITEPSRIIRESITIGNSQSHNNRYIIGADCNGCGKCFDICPQKCINTRITPAVIEQNHCLHCGLCTEICPVGAIKRS